MGYGDLPASPHSGSEGTLGRAQRLSCCWCFCLGHMCCPSRCLHCSRACQAGLGTSFVLPRRDSGYGLGLRADSGLRSLPTGFFTISDPFQP